MASWFRSFESDEADGLEEFEAFVRSIDTDPSWRGWWSRSAFKQLEIRPTPVEAPADRPLVIEHPKRFVLAQPAGGLVEPDPAGRAGATEAELFTRWAQDAVLVGLDNVGKILGLGPGPGREQAYRSAPDPQPQSTADLRPTMGPLAQMGHPVDGDSADEFRIGDDAEVERLRAAHPRFVASFRHRIYDTDDYRNDDRMPFGTDEGADTVAEWNDRTDELTAETPLSQLLGGSGDDFSTDSNPDDDDMLIAAGFSLLRFTGRIDAEGGRWVMAALKRQKSRDAGSEYRRMLKDLENFLAPS